MEPIPEGVDPIDFMREKARAHAERHQAMNEVAGHDLTSLLTSMTSDQLGVVASLLDTITTSPHPARVAAFYTGRVVTIRELKFGMCPHCGSKHDDASELLKDEAGAIKPPFDPELFTGPEVPEHVRARRAMDEKADESFWTEMGSRGILMDHELFLMNRFNLDDLREEGTGKLLGFICLGCRTQYVSIKDRAKQPPGPEGCSGCQQKAKWG